MSGNKDLRRAKHEAYQKKQAAKGEKVVKWIFISLIALGALLCHLCSFYSLINFYRIKRVRNEWIGNRKKIPRQEGRRLQKAPAFSSSHIQQGLYSG